MITQNELTEFASKHSWAKQMANSRGLDSFDNYSGPDLGDLIVVLGRNRDSDILSESNFESALDRLGGKSFNVMVERFGHWACGWFELILVNPASNKHVKIAYEISKELERYPVLDDDDFSEREHEYQSEYADSAKNQLSYALAMHFGLKDTKALQDIAYELNMAEQSYGGNDSCVDIYANRAPDSRDIKDLTRTMDSIRHNYEKSRTFKALQSAVKAYKAIV